jgi:hypothetical protein
MKNIKLNINNGDNTNIDYLYIWDIIGKRPSTVVLHNNLDDGILSSILDKKFKGRVLGNTSADVVPLTDEIIENIRYFYKLCDGVWISYTSIDGYDKRFDSDIHIIYDIEKQNIVDDIVHDICQHTNETDTVVNKDNILCLREGVLDTEPMGSHNNYDDIDIFYTKKVYTKIKKLIKTINNTDNGITILCGPRGTGKTNCMRYISLNTDDITIFIPNNLVEHSINNPEFRNLVSRYQKVILFIDDCEFITNSQFSKMNYFTSNIIQLTDSMVNTRIHVVLSFNEDIDKIDQNILDANGLESVIEFGSLAIDESAELSKHLGINRKVEHNMTLRDVLKGTKYKSRKIGL